MFRWNHGLVIALCVGATVISNGACTYSQTIGQYPSPAAQQAYYHRPDRMLEPDEFLAKARQSNSQSVFNQYEQMLQQNRPQSNPYSGRYEYSVIPQQQPPQQQLPPEQQIPSRLIPPGARSQPMNQSPPANQKTYAQPNFSLSAAPVSPEQRFAPQRAYPSLPTQHHLPAVNDARIMTQWNHLGSAARKIPSHSRPVNSQARIIGFHQDVPQNNRQDRQNNPFDEPPSDIAGSDNRNQNQDPFADPPADILQNQQLPDPFDDPPADMQGDDQQQPEQEQTPDPPPVDPDPLQGFDPFPNTPNDLDPNAPPRPERDPAESGANQVAPGRTPNQRRDERLPYRTGPYEAFNGYQPKRLLPAPPEREYPDYTPQIVQPYFQYDQTDEMLSQPTLMAGGFETGQLYEGITYDHDARMASYQCDSCDPSYAKRRMPILEGLKNKFAKFARIGRYDHQICDVPHCASCDGSGVISQQPLFDDYQGMPIEDCGDCGYCDDCQFGRFKVRQKFAAMAANRGDYAQPVAAGACCCEPMFYYSVFGGYTTTDDLPSRRITFPPGSRSTAFTEDGFGVGIAMGQWQGRNLRTEIEYVFRSNDVDTVEDDIFLQGISSRDIDGSLQTHAGMFNVYWDFNRSYFSLRPYVGCGVGFAFYDHDNINREVGFDITDSTFAYQWIAGVSKSRGCNRDWFIEYRRFYGDEFYGNISSVSPVRYKTDNVFFGLRKRF